MKKYITRSLIVHSVLLVALVIVSILSFRSAPKTLELIVLPKGTSLDATLTQDVIDAMKAPKPPEDTTKPDVATDATPPTPAPSPTPQPDDAQQAEAPDTVNPTPAPTAAPTPAPTPVLTPAPTPAPTATPNLTPKPERAKPTPTPTPKPKPTPKPTPKATPTPKPPKEKAETERKKKPTPTPKSRKNAKPTPTPTPTPKPKVKSAYDIEESGALPSATPAGATVSDRVPPGGRAGVPGVPEGVEGAPLALDGTQNLLNAMYATRARMKIQGNFSVPPGVDEPTMNCVVEWEILPDGTIQNVRIAQSSGRQDLDSCALDALNRTQTLGPLPPDFGGRSVWTSLKFEFGSDASVPVLTP